MIRGSRATRLMAGLGLALVVSFTTPLSAHAADDLIDAVPAHVSILAPAPGESQSWEMSVANLTDQSLPILLRSNGASDTLFGGQHPLQIELRVAETGDTVYSGGVSRLLDEELDLRTLGARSELTLNGRVFLPSDAGNEYQEADASLQFTFITVADAPSHPLATTGGELSTALLVLAAALLAAGAVAFSMRKKEKA